MRKFIVGSDWWTDCDDVVAFRLIARAVSNGEITVKGIGLNACMPDSASSLIGFLKSEGIPVPPIGIDLNGTDFGGNPPYQKRLAKICVPRVENEELENAADLYIRLLKETDEKLEIIEIGYPQVLSEVIERETKLFSEKVERIWMMAGKWDVLPGKENNFARNERSRIAAHKFCENCPVPVLFLGWEISYNIITGGLLKETDVLHQVLCDHGSMLGRSSWDPMLVQLALTGDPGKAGYEVVTGKASVDPLTGENDFKLDPTGKHGYVKKKMPDEYYRRLIDENIASR